MSEKIVLGDETFTPEHIKDSTVVLKESVIGDELQHDELSAEMDMASRAPWIFCPAGTDGMMTSDGLIVCGRGNVDMLIADPTVYSYGTPVVPYWNDRSLGKFFMTSIVQTGRSRWKITAVSKVGLLGRQRHYGGIYRGEPFAEVAADIIGDTASYILDDALKNQAVFGYLPVSTRRENLHQLLFAMGAAIRKHDNADFFITGLRDDAPSSIPDERVFVGGSVRHNNMSSKVIVHEHTFNAYDTDEEIKLYDGEVATENIVTPQGASVSGTIVLFSEPMHDLTVENGSILESGVNYAVLGPGGGVILRGKKYTHAMRAVVRPVTETANVTESSHVVEKATLVSPLNSEAVADRLYSYYSSAETIETDILVENEQPGDSITISDPFDREITGIISSMVMSPSGILRAQMEIVNGYSTDIPLGNAYSQVAVFTKSGTWISPVTGKIRGVLVGGGDGGWSGGDGTDGEYSVGAGYGQAGKPGVAGLYGNGGKILVFTTDVVEGETYDITLGRGGAGGVNNGTQSVQGGLGTPTTFGRLFTSAQGAPSSGGYTELFSGEIYGKRGKSGIAGGKGGDPDTPFGTKVVGTDGVEYSAPRKRDDYSSTAEGNKTQSGSVFPRTRWTDEAPALYVDADYEAGNGYVTVTVNLYHTTEGQTFGYDVNAQVWIDGVSAGATRLKGNSPSSWDSIISADFTGSASGTSAVVEVLIWSTGGAQRNQSFTATISLPDENRTTLNAGGYGGGPAANASGGQSGTSIPYGGDGANATISGADATTPGEGGCGGHGGGSGGAGGYIKTTIENYGSSTDNLRGGYAGKGSDGGNGADGIALIYF